MKDIYNLRLGDMLYKTEQGKAIIGVVHKLTSKYAYYVICAQLKNGAGPAFLTRGHKVEKTRLYNSIASGTIDISYAGGIKRRKMIKERDLS